MSIGRINGALAVGLAALTAGCTSQNDATKILGESLSNSAYEHMAKQGRFYGTNSYTKATIRNACIGAMQENGEEIAEWLRQNNTPITVKMRDQMINLCTGNLTNKLTNEGIQVTFKDAGKIKFAEALKAGLKIRA